MYQKDDLVTITNDELTNFNGRIALVVKPFYQAQEIGILVLMLTGALQGQKVFFWEDELSLLYRK